ncbi:CLUMA_CG014816, isoform A [Clunio marinus]|uniref:CLUMA_CG014816, isoform A n=1 Tax=Clunio marinus TaxID=568069 RepID=A0A1J1IS96_9DIPT|nr:CLUMA_CG014816, isoform A [Clunio marinus]
MKGVKEIFSFIELCQVILHELGAKNLIPHKSLKIYLFHKSQLIYKEYLGGNMFLLISPWMIILRG